MPAATCKSNLIHNCDRDFAKLTVLLDNIALHHAVLEDDSDRSIKDIVAHRAHWVHLTLGWAKASRQGLSPAMPAPGYKWNQLKLYKQRLKEAQAELSWSEARTELRRAHMDLMREIDRSDDALLYGTPMAGGNGTWTMGRYFEACGASHYRSAAKYVRARKRAWAHSKAKAA